MGASVVAVKLVRYTLTNGTGSALATGRLPMEASM
jgi:hypothetical protein